MKRIDEECVKTIMLLAVDAVERANSGHPGMPMGDGTMAYALWDGFLKHSPENPRWPNRDRFVLSAGHGSMLLYSLLHLTGYGITLDDIKGFRQWGSKTPGHPECHPDLGVETTTGPLGQGFATGVGMAMAERYLAGMFNRPGFPIVDHHIYGIVSDGDLMEGVSQEAASLAGHLGLGKMIYLYSDNKVTIEGSTDLSFSEDVAKRFDACGWHVERVDGYDMKGIGRAIRAAKAEKKRPSLIIARTQIGYCSPNKQGCAAAHGAPLGEDEVKLVKGLLGFPEDKHFHVPREVRLHMGQAVKRGREEERRWAKLLAAYRKKYPELAARWDEMSSGTLPMGWEEALPRFSPADGKVATRSASGKVLNAIAGRLPQLVGGSADLAPSNNTYLKGQPDFSPKAAGRNIHFGIREHAMGAVMNGMALSGMLIPYGGTFFVFSDYVRPACRLSALMDTHVVYVMTHDSVAVGEDGPTHQPVEHLASFRAMPNMTVIRPADANETAEAWRLAIEKKSGPVMLVLSRQNLPVLDRSVYAPASGLRKGAYVISDSKGRPDVMLIASGSEVPTCLEAADRLRAEGVAVRVVNMASMELFEAQPRGYRDKVLPPAVTKRLAVEAGTSFGWHKYAGGEGAVLGIDRFGASAPGKALLENFGFTVENVVRQARALTKGPRG